MGKPLKLLLIEDNAGNIQQILDALRLGGFEVTSETIHESDAMTQAMGRHTWDMVIARSLAQLNISTTLLLVKNMGWDIPVIVVTDEAGEANAAEFMHQGAQDYVLEGHWIRLLPTVERELRNAEGRQLHRQANERLQQKANYDLLTGLPNRVMFHDRLTLALAQAARHRRMLSVMFVDLDRFRTIVDTLGHAASDELLQRVAERLSNCLDVGETLSRFGGDEFVVLLPQIPRTEKAIRVAQAIIDALKKPFSLQGQELHLTASVGITIYPYDGDSVDILFKNADTALNRAKEHGRNNYQLYTPAMNARAFERLALENSLRRALERSEFVLHYQPQVDIQAVKIVGAEALVRWQHPDLGLVFPHEFITLAEETGLIVPLGEWVLRTACAQAKAWEAAGLPPIRLAVNLSGRQFQDQDLVGTISKILKETKLNPSHLEVEITESVAMQNADYSIVMLNELKKMGLHISMDDFGTGYSSLSYLKKFPIDTLKIDQSFIRDLETDASNAAIAQAVIVLAHSLKLAVIAEGIETREQHEFLKAHQCDRLQGFLFSRAVPAKEFEELVRKRLPKSQPRPE